MWCRPGNILPNETAVSDVMITTPVLYTYNLTTITCSRWSLVTDSVKLSGANLNGLSVLLLALNNISSLGGGSIYHRKPLFYSIPPFYQFHHLAKGVGTLEELKVA